MLERGGVQREAVPLGDHLAAQHPAGRVARVGERRLEDVHADPEDVVGVAGGEVDVPAAVDAVQFRRPDVAAHLARSPGAARSPTPLAVAEPGDGGRAADDDPVVLRHRAGEVVHAVDRAGDERVGPLLDQRVRRWSRRRSAASDRSGAVAARRPAVAAAGRSTAGAAHAEPPAAGYGRC